VVRDPRVHLAPRATDALGPAPHLALAAARLGADVVHLFHVLSVKTLAPLALVPARLFAEYNGGAVPPRSPRRLVLRAASSRLSALFVTARVQARPFVETGAVRADLPIVTVPEVSSILSDGTPDLRDRSRAALGIDAATKLVLSVGRLDADKDHFTTLAALERVATSHPRVRFVLAAQSGELRDAFEAHVARTAALRDRVELRWAAPQPRLPELYAAADVFVHASRREISGYAFIEALQFGLPIVASDIPAFRAMGADVPRFAPPGDVDAFTRALVAALDDGPAARARSRRRFEAALSFDAIARRKLAAYRGAPPSNDY
ncbi:glycosyltransferase, partial [Myxococcota bacterium]|nr:glycosyltransferase [Myxococcota bacterium]